VGGSVSNVPALGASSETRIDADHVEMGDLFLSIANGPALIA